MYLYEKLYTEKYSHVRQLLPYVSSTLTFKFHECFSNIISSYFQRCRLQTRR